jgi:hypothetical protein
METLHEEARIDCGPLRKFVFQLRVQCFIDVRSLKASSLSVGQRNINGTLKGHAKALRIDQRSPKIRDFPTVAPYDNVDNDRFPRKVNFSNFYF